MQYIFALLTKQYLISRESGQVILIPEQQKNADVNAYLCLCGGQDMYDRFGVVAVIVLPHVGDRGEG